MVSINSLELGQAQNLQKSTKDHHKLDWFNLSNNMPESVKKYIQGVN